MKLSPKFSVILAAHLLIVLTNISPIYAATAWESTNMTGKALTSLAVTSQGVLVGEYSASFADEIYNGVWISRDLGTNWEQFGLENRGITDIYFDGNELYATTYYFTNSENGIFKYDNELANWKHLGQDFSSTSVASKDSVVILGTYSHGLRVSFDGGETWEQKIGTGHFGPKIIKVAIFDNVALAALETETYISTDNAVTWVKMADLNGINIHRFAQLNNSLYAGARNNSGMYRSNDNGQTWSWVANWGNNAVSSLSTHDSVIYAGKHNTQTNQHTMYKSLDNGNSWEEFGLTMGQAKSIDIEFVSSYPDIAFALANNTVLYKTQLEYKFKINPFLSVPWDAETDYELYDKITANFDHEYPLNGYSVVSEPSERQDTTTNFMGIRDKIPYQYYSGHNGTDFGLKYGTNIYAAASGIASYYTCKDCGHTIKIDHTNGYQTIYMHLQDSALITDATQAVPVNEGQIIGKVGMTGNTSGPHLHFTVAKGATPAGLVDPFSWLNRFFADPWAKYSWIDVLGEHIGAVSDYLWKIGIPFETSYSGNDSVTVTHGNKQITLEKNSTNQGFTVYLSHFIAPQTGSTNKKLQYVSNSSLIANILSNTGTEIPIINKPAVIEIDLGTSDLKDIKLDSLKVYHWNDALKSWEPIESIFDLAEMKIFGKTYSFSHFAVFGESLAQTEPQTKINITGDSLNGWYTQFPSIEFTTNNPDQLTTFYSLENDIWNEYTGPFLLEKEGIINIKYRSMSNENNVVIEPMQDMNIRIDTMNKWKKTLRVVNGLFEL